jgi:hypothetical protein
VTVLDQSAPTNDGAFATQEHPGQDPETEQYGDRNEDLPEELQNLIKDAVREVVEQETYDRRREVIRDRKLRFYERGEQHVYVNGKTGQFYAGEPGGVVSVDGREIQCSDFLGTWNIFQPSARTIQATLTQNPPGIDFQPDDPTNPNDMEAASAAELVRRKFNKQNDVKKIQTQIVRMMELSGRTIIWTRTEANGQLFGLNEDGAPRRAEVATVHGTLESRVPVTAKSQDDCGFLFLLDDVNIKEAKATYPKFAKKIQSGSTSIAEQDFERTARLGVLQGRKGANTGSAKPHLVTVAHCWLRPSNFTGDKYDRDFAPGQTAGNALRQLFPSGCHVVFVGDVYVGSWDESMDDCLVIGFPYEGDGMSRMPIMEPAVQIQDTFNDKMNIGDQVFEVGWPSTWTDADDAEYAAIQSQVAMPYAIRQLKHKPNTAMPSRFFREPGPELPASFVQFVEMLQGPLLQFILATPPALFGGNMTDQKTASGYAQARAQAMGQLGIIWGSVQAMMARMYYHAALCAGKNTDYSGPMSVANDDGGSDFLDVSELSKGSFRAYPDEDSSFPESTSAKRATLTQLVTMAATSPVGASLFESPENWSVMNRLLGLPELELPQVAARDKQLREIEILLQTPPIPGDPNLLQSLQVQHAAQSTVAQQTGQPAPTAPNPEDLMQTTVPVDELDFHQYEAEKGKEWLSSEACWREIHQKNNQEGVLNVKLHVKAHLQMAAQQMAAMAPPPPTIGKPVGMLKGPGTDNPPGAPGAPTM